MKILKFTIVGLLLSLGLGVACSEQVRTVNWNPSVVEVADAVNVFLNEAQAANSSVFIQDVKTHIDNQEPQGVIYYSEGGLTGHPTSVAAVLDFSIFGLPEASYLDVETSKVLLLDKTVDKTREFTIIISVQLKKPDGSLTQTLTASFKTSNFVFDSKFAILNFGDFSLKTFDLHKSIEDDFAGHIQLKVLDSKGVNFGQFSSLLGFG